MMSTTDEFIIDVDKVTNILTAKSHIEELFHVTLILGEEIKDDGKQWLEVRGNTQERKAAKEYILALCDSALLACLEYPLHMKNNFMDSKLCAQIERDSSVVLDFDKPGQIRIKGNDAVSVTQAYIALEDIISKLSGRDSKQPQGESCASVEIDSLDNKIKDVVLDVLLEKGNDQELSAYGIRKHIVNNVADNKTCFFSKEHEREVQHAKSLQEGDEQLKLCDLPKKQKVDSEKESNDPAHHFKQFALDNGYSEEKVENIFATFGRDVSFDVFYRALNDIVTPNDGSDSVNDISNETKRKGAGTTHPVSSNVFNQQKDSAKTSDMEPDKDSVIKQIISEEMLKYSSTVAKARNSEVIELSSDDDDDDHIDLTNDSSDSEHYSSVKRQTQENCMTALDQGRLQRQLLAFSQLAMPSNHGASLQPTTFVEAAAASCIPEGELRHVVIDGSNVAMTHGREKVFSCRGIELVVKYFKNRGHKNITAFVPQWRLINMSDRYPITDKYLLRSLQNDGFLVFTPARRVPGKNIACYDDRYILRLAHLVDGVIVSNDNYRDLWFEQPEWRGVIEKRLLMYSFVGDIFMPPDDPLGRDGPSLTDFLRKPSMQEQMQQPRIIPVRPLMANAPMQQFRYGDSGSNSGKRNSSQVVQNPHSFGVPQAANWRHKDNPDGYACYQSRFTGQTSVSSEPMQPQGFNQVPIKQPRHMPPSGKVRDEACTQRLLTSLKEVFSDCAAIQRVLDENPTEENLNVLSDHVLNYMTN